MCLIQTDLLPIEQTNDNYRERQTMNPPASQVLLVEDDPRMPEVLAALLQDDNITLVTRQRCAPRR